MSDAIEDFLSQLHHPMLASIDLSLDRMKRLLALLGSPHKRVPPVIHVAGTNGKGSLLANLRGILSAAGYTSHRYTSPHLVHFRERIVVADQEIDDDALLAIMKHVAPVLESQPVTFFEATTAVAFLAFAETKADVLLLETGLGGKLDATNVIKNPMLTAITPVSFDHKEYLGNDLPTIAAEKAGIVKPGVACVVGKQKPEALEVIEKRADALESPLYRMGVEWFQDKGVYHSAWRTLEFKPGLEGAHQYDNAATAMACVDMMPQFTITDAHITQGLAAAHWPARLQRLIKGPYAEMLPEGIELWLDGGHNPQGGEVLGEWLKEKPGEAYLICGMIIGKDARGFLAPLTARTKALYAVPIPGEKQARPPAKVMTIAQAAGIEAEAAESVEKALQTIAQRARKPAVVCICGSLYLAGKVLAAGNG